MIHCSYQENLSLLLLLFTITIFTIVKLLDHILINDENLSFHINNQNLRIFYN